MIKENINSSLIFHILKFSDTIRRFGDEITQRYGITTQQWLIMLLLAKDPNMVYLKERKKDQPILAKDLADAMNVSRANITNLVNVLINKNLIRQITDGIDKRRKMLELTPEGEHIILELEKPRQIRNQLLFSTFSMEEKMHFISFIRTSLMVIYSSRSGNNASVEHLA